MSGYTRMQKRLTEQDVTAGLGSRASGDAPSNSAMLSAYGLDAPSDSDLDAKMAARFSAFLGNQNPAAEGEADRWAAAVPSSARTPEEVKSQLGAAMGTDFSAIRFHTGGEAVRRTDAVGARAYTAGQDVDFGREGFDPAVAAHELVHTAQQGTAVPAGGGMTASVTPVAAGTVQMMPRWLGRIGAFFTELFNGKPGKAEKRANRERAERGDFSRWFRMGKKDKRRMVGDKKAELNAMVGVDPTADENRIQLMMAGLAPDTTAMLNPVTREAMSQIASEGGENAPIMAELGERMDKQMMINTMRKPSAQQRANVAAHYRNYDDVKLLDEEYHIANAGKTYFTGDDQNVRQNTRNVMGQLHAARQAGGPLPTREAGEAEGMARGALDKARGSGGSLLKLMFLMQLGKFQEVDKRGRGRDWAHTMANTFSHGGRTTFKMNTNDGEEDSMDAMRQAIFGDADSTGLERRSAATHYLDKSLKEGASLPNLRTKLGSGFRNFGMDMAIGGIGNGGVATGNGTSKMISNDGRSGHMYIGQRSGGARQRGGFLVGMETDSPYRMNQRGHMHNMLASSEKSSSTGGHKSGRKGAKENGRVVDLGGLSNRETLGLVQQFETYANGLRETDEEGYNRLLEQMSGKKLGEEEMKALLGNIHGENADRERIDDLYRRARGL